MRDDENNEEEKRVTGRIIFIPSDYVAKGFPEPTRL